MTRRFFVVCKGEKYMTSAGGWTKDIRKAIIWPKAPKGLPLPKGAEVVPHWVSGEAW